MLGFSGRGAGFPEFCSFLFMIPMGMELIHVDCISENGSHEDVRQFTPAQMSWAIPGSASLSCGCIRVESLHSEAEESKDLEAQVFNCALTINPQVALNPITPNLERERETDRGEKKLQVT